MQSVRRHAQEYGAEYDTPEGLRFETQPPMLIGDCSTGRSAGEPKTSACVHPSAQVKWFAISLRWGESMQSVMNVPRKKPVRNVDAVRA